MSVLKFEGTLIECKRKQKSYKNGHESAEKLFISLADVELTEEQLEVLNEAFKDAGKKFTPAWILEPQGYINLSSQFELPAILLDGTRTDSIEDYIADGYKWMGATVKLTVNVKDGAVYPKALKFLSEGKELDPFAELEDDEDW